MTRPRLEVAEVIRSCRDAFLQRYGAGLTPEQRRALDDLTACRTAALGGHVLECPGCGHQEVAYNSCGNRHCPKCQATAAARWLEAQAADLLETPYFHVVFTLPGALGPVALAQPPRGLRPADAGRRGDPARGGRRPEAPRGRGRRAGGAAHLGPEPRAAPARPLRRHRRRAGARREPLGRRPRRLLPAGPRPQPRVPGQVPGRAPRRLRAGAAPLPGPTGGAGPARIGSTACSPRRSGPNGSCTPSRRGAGPRPC